MNLQSICFCRKLPIYSDLEANKHYHNLLPSPPRIFQCSFPFLTCIPKWACQKSGFFYNQKGFSESLIPQKQKNRQEFFRNINKIIANDPQEGLVFPPVWKWPKGGKEEKWWLWEPKD